MSRAGMLTTTVDGQYTLITPTLEEIEHVRMAVKACTETTPKGYGFGTGCILHWIRENIPNSPLANSYASQISYVWDFLYE